MEEVRLTEVGARASSVLLEGKGSGRAAARVESAMKTMRKRRMANRGVIWEEVLVKGFGEEF